MINVSKQLLFSKPCSIDDSGELRFGAFESSEISNAMVPEHMNVYQKDGGVEIEFQYPTTLENEVSFPKSEFVITTGNSDKIVSVYFPEFSREAVAKFVEEYDLGFWDLKTANGTWVARVVSNVFELVSLR